MRRILLALCLALLLAAGCQKIRFNGGQTPQQQGQPSTQNQPAIHAPTGVVINPGVGGGGGDAVQAVRKAAKRAATQNDMSQLRLLIETAFLSSGQMPTSQEIATELQKEAPHIYKMWQDKVIAVTGTQKREHIWAYTVDSVSVANYHLIISSKGVETIGPQELRQRLKQETGQ